MYIAIVGAGPGGLISFKKCVEDGHKCIVFEQMGHIGGTWYYSENTDTDEHGTKIHSGLYYGLRTNLPKELMQFEDFPHEDSDRSYLSHENVLKYIIRYANEYKLHQFIKLCHQIVHIDPLENEKWKITIKNTVTKSIQNDVFDAVIISAGVQSVPNFPHIDDLHKFSGSVIHSHKFRRVDKYKNKKVLLIGCGLSGIDISKLIAEVAEKVYLSKRIEYKPFFKVSEKVKLVPPVKQFFKNKVQFVDDSQEYVDDVIFCTGYLYSFPFLSPACGIKVENKWIKYLYKHIINVEHPTMAFLGIPDRVCKFVIFGMQVRFFLALLKVQFSVTKDKMMEDVLLEERRIMGLNREPNHPHNIGLEQGLYLEDLAKTANIENNIPPVIQKMLEYVVALGYSDYDSLFKIHNKDEFTHSKILNH